MKIKEFVRKYWEYILAFLIPLIIVLLHCITRNSWLFGRGSILKGDAGLQYIYIYEELWNKVHNGDFSFFSWNAVGGFDFYLNVLYYTISPSTLIVLLLPKSCIENTLQAFMVIKWALLSFSAVYFFMHTKFNTLKENRKFVSLTLGLCYALSSFLLHMICLFNWMDTIILFPFLLLLVEHMVEKGTWKWYYIALTAAICCNCYIAFPMCIFLFLWFLLQLQTVSKVDKKVFAAFFGTSVWAAFSAMAVLLPSVFNVGSRYTSGGNGAVSSYIKSIPETLAGMISKFFVLSMPMITGNGKGDDVRFYLSIGMAALCLMFGFIKINKRVKYSKIGIAVLMIASCFFGALRYIWQGFSVPHGYDPRHGFLMIMVLLLMALNVLTHVDQLKIWNCLLMLGVGVVMFFYTFFHIQVYEDVAVYLATILLLVFYFILMVLLCRKSITTRSFILVFCALCMVEVGVNAYHQFQTYNVIKPDDREFLREAAELSGDLRLEKGQRVIFADAGVNPGMKTQLPSMTGYVSFFNGNMGNLSFGLGMSIVEDAAIIYAGGTPLLNLMFNNAYGIGEYETVISEPHIVKEGKDLNLYQTDQLAGLGYMVKDSVTGWCENEDTSFELHSFELQNQFAKLATGIEEDLFQTFIPDDLQCVTTTGKIEPEKEAAKNNGLVYHYVPVLDTDGNQLDCSAEKDMNLYFTMGASAPANICISVDDQVVYWNTREIGVVILPIGKVKKGQKISITCAIEEQAGKDSRMLGQFAELNEDVWESVYHALSADVYHITEMKSDYISGTIETDEDGIMMTSVPAMKGFDVYVDGEKSGYHAIGGALIGVPVKKGSHIVEFRYHTPFAGLGWLMSVCGIGAYIIICMTGKRKNASVFCEE